MRSESSPGYCFDHPGVRQAELAFFTALARRAARSPAFLGWDLWSEPHIINWATANYLYRPEFCFDFERSSAYSPNGAGGFWIGELQAGFGTVALNVGATVTPQDLRMWTWSAIARGAKGIHYYAWYPMSTGYESGGYGLIQLDGTITERARAAGEVARVIDRNQQLLLHARPPRAQVAILFNPLAYMVGGRQRAATATGPQSEVGSIERDSWLGAYRALFPTNVPVDFVHLNEATAEQLRVYKLVLFPYPLMMPERAAHVLRAYVEAGGTVVSEARLGWNNERGHASPTIPGMGLHEVTGCRETAVESVAGLKTELVWSADEILHPGDRLPARLFEETLEPAGPQSHVAARFASGAPAAVFSRFGRGRALTLGSYLAVAFEVQRDPALARFFSALLDWARVDRPVESDVEVRWLESGAEKILFLFNHADHAVTPAVRLHLPAVSATDLITGDAVALPPRKLLAPQDVWILRVK
jgi:beta-galactosidase